MFWRSGILTGNQTNYEEDTETCWFWRSGILTGNQTKSGAEEASRLFWRSGILTGNQTTRICTHTGSSFGAVAF